MTGEAEKELMIEVIGSEPSCVKCLLARKAVERVVKKLNLSNVKIEKRYVFSKDVVEQYGLLMSPSIAFNGVVKFRGNVPNDNEIEQEIKAAFEC